ncbi:MAG: DUF2784 domain-containing protein [Wenzhouxiangella sp.]
MNIYEQIPNPGLMADIVLVAHALIVVFVIVGQALILIGWARGWHWVRNFWFRLAHLVTIGIVVAQAWLGRLCPLTIWEQELRRAAGQAFYQQSFIEYWLAEVLYLDLPWWAFVTAYTVFGLLVLLTWWRVPPKWPASGTAKGMPDSLVGFGRQ